MNQVIRLGLSTCPNDTFAMAALIDRRVDWQGLKFEIELMDIGDLNSRWIGGGFDVAKASFHAALSITDRTVVLPTGSALGFGVGPLLLAAKAATTVTADSVVLCPGPQTTATLLLKLFYPEATNRQHVVFSEIMPSLEQGSADFGVCIHEGRFTWKQTGLHCVEDLGTRWETEFGVPLPLGGILANRSLGHETIGKVQRVLRDSLQLALADPDSSLPMMRKHAQELDDNVLMKHVELYVNDWTLDLGEMGRSSLAVLSQQAIESGWIPHDATPIEIFE